MNSDTQAVTIDRSCDEVFNFLSDPQNLSKWAKGLCEDVRRDGDDWIIQTGMGEAKVSFETDKKSGVIDIFITPAFPIEIVARSRVVPNGESCDYIFTSFQIPLLPAEAFGKQKEKIAQGLLELKTFLESQ